ncbi:hypothetical protein ACFWC6_34330, partial [Micromonospora chalcea]
RWHVPGRVEAVYLRGELIAQRGRFVGRQDAGRFLARRRA